MAQQVSAGRENESKADISSRRDSAFSLAGWHVNFTTPPLNTHGVEVEEAVLSPRVFIKPYSILRPAADGHRCEIESYAML